MKLLSFINAPGFMKLAGLILITICILFLGTLGIYAIHTGKTVEAIGMIIGAMISIITTIIGFYWGSSSGSKDKDDTLKGLLNQTTPPAPMVLP